VSLPAYAHLQEKGLLIALVALDEGKMVGYACALLAPNLHYGYLMGVNDVVFVRESYRYKGYGLRLMREMEKKVGERGARFMVWQAKLGSSLNKILPRLGYRAEEVNYIKELKNGV
ncbi:MAG: GNAT family N-acetyltransferase, partial [Saezia sp.]